MTIIILLRFKSLLRFRLAFSKFRFLKVFCKKDALQNFVKVTAKHGNPHHFDKLASSKNNVFIEFRKLLFALERLSYRLVVCLHVES